MVKALIEELKDIRFNINGFDWNKIYDIVVKSSDYLEYSKGGEISEFGIYPMEPFSAKWCSNKKPGRKIKDISNGFTYKYYFREGKLIAMEKYLDEEFNYLTVYSYSNNEKKAVRFNVKKDRVSFVAKCQYDTNGRLIRYIEGDYDHTNKIHLVRELIFNYIDDDISVEFMKITNFLELYRYYIVNKEYWKMTDDDVEFISKEKSIKVGADGNYV